MEHKPLLQHGVCYHVYNRGINKAPLFLYDDDYLRFIYLMQVYLYPVSGVYSYALMKNHFHICLRIKNDDEIGWLIPENEMDKDPAIKWSTTFNDSVSLTMRKKPEPNSMLRHLLNAYTRWFNRRHGRSGKLFEERHERKILLTKDYLRQLIIYINRNPAHHKVVRSFKRYPWISYHELIDDSPTWLARRQVSDVFGSLQTFIAAMGKVDFDVWLKELEYEVVPDLKRS